MSENQMVTVIKPMKGLISINVKELWRYRDLFLTFVWRDLKVRYKQTVLGALWAIIPPVLSMVVFSIFFGNFAHLSEQEFVHGMTSMMRVTDNIYVSMMRDIYGMGKVLSRKFALLKKAYDVFMFGLIIAIVLYVGAFVAVALK